MCRWTFDPVIYSPKGLKRLPEVEAFFWNKLAIHALQNSERIGDRGIFVRSIGNVIDCQRSIALRQGSPKRIVKAVKRFRKWFSVRWRGRGTESCRTSTRNHRLEPGVIFLLRGAFALWIYSGLGSMCTQLSTKRHVFALSKLSQINSTALSSLLAFRWKRESRHNSTRNGSIKYRRINEFADSPKD